MDCATEGERALKMRKGGGTKNTDEDSGSHKAATHTMSSLNISTSDPSYALEASPLLHSQVTFSEVPRT